MFFDIMGSSWQNAAFAAMSAVIFALGFFLYSTSFCCSSQVRAIRYLNGLVLSIFLVVVQGSTFIAFNSTFCDDNSCSFSRAAWFSVVAMLCYFVAGIAFFFTRDYPGDSVPSVPPATHAVAYAYDVHPTIARSVPTGSPDDPLTMKVEEDDRTMTLDEAPTSDAEVVAQPY
jgi:hypothetical protein